MASGALEQAGAPLEVTSVAPKQTPEQPSDAAADVTARDGLESQVDRVERQVAGMDLNGQGNVSEGDLHRACAEGNLDEVRAVLSRGLEALEVPDAISGCTPIVLAIRYNHHDVVKELLSAGAMVPPPGLTSDPLMLSLLYPPNMYGAPPYMHMGPPEFYPLQQQQQQQQQPQPSSQQQPGGYYPAHGPRMSFSAGHQDGTMLPMEFGANGSNLPPLDVAKTIPCRNFPNCKYGNNCAFYHPRLLPPQQAAYYGAAMPVMPNGYDQGYPAYMPAGPAMAGQYFQPGQPAFIPAFQPQQNLHQSSPPSSQPAQPISEQESSQPQEPQSESQQSEEKPAMEPSAEVESISRPAEPVSSSDDAAAVPVPVPSQHAMSAAIPAFQPQAPTVFGMSPMSPTGLAGGSLPPLGAPVFVPGRRQSFNNPAFGGPGKPFGGHGKKPSFSGGPRPWPSSNRASIGGAGPNGAGLGSWKDGVPPPCAFFAQAKCRNGEFCKFPHIDQDGNDCRHPDVVRGLMAPLPTLSRQHRNMRLSNGGGGGGFAPFNPAFQQQQHLAFMRGASGQQAAAGTEAEGAANTTAPTVVEEEALDTSEASPAVKETAETKEATVDTKGEPAVASAAPAAPVPATAAPVVASAQAKPNAAGSGTNVARSASTPGLQRAHANANGSRSHSPAAGNGSFHGGHSHAGQRRAHSRPGFQHANGHNNHHNNQQHHQGGHRSVSAGGEKSTHPQQRLPRADDFPALSGNGEAKSASKETPKPNGFASGKTAAQVLAEPAPPKPVKPARVASAEDSKSDSGKSDNALSVSMESEAGTDAVVISLKASTAPTTATTTPSGSASPVKASVSFASIAGSVPAPALATAAATAPASAPEAATVAVKAA